jgi:two-component system sensor histidine kinase UhpB
MWHSLSLRARLILLVAVALVLGMSANIARLVLDAAPRVQAEDQSVVRLAVEFVHTLVADLDRAPNPEDELAQIVRDMAELRHVRVARVGPAGDAASTPAHPADDVAQAPGVPSWFVALVRPEQTTVTVPVEVDGRSLGALAITPLPTDEMAEIWDGIVVQVEVGLAITVGFLLLTIWVVNRALAPVELVKAAMTDLEAGRYATRVAPGGSPEIATICVKLNELAAVLGATVEGNRRLAERVVSLQDVERREIARDLHDEFGPHLFAVRAQASALQQAIAGAQPDRDGLKRQADALLGKINDIQQINRRVLERLRPVGLAEFGLEGALAALLAFWRETRPDTAVETSIAPALGALGDTVELTIYRIIQEALTNVFRHAGASRVDITVAPASNNAAPGGHAVTVSVRDNGDGLPADYRQGFGLTGMRERVQALGGTMTVTSSSQGSLISATLPCSPLAVDAG